MSVEANEAALSELLESPTGAVAHELERVALLVENAQKLLLSQHGTGRVYDTTFWTDSTGRLRRGRARVPHQASAPGEPPAPDFGLLRASISHVVLADNTGLYAEIGSGANPAIPSVAYGVYTDQGTRHMAPRPWLQPSLDAAKE
jgi:hypothetical protein